MAIWNNEFYGNHSGHRYSRRRPATKYYPGNTGPKASAGDTVVAMAPNGKKVMATVLRGPDTSGTYELRVLAFDQEVAGASTLRCLSDALHVTRKGSVRVR